MLTDVLSRYYHEIGQYRSCEALLKTAQGLAAKTSGTNEIILSKLYYYHGRLSQEMNQP